MLASMIQFLFGELFLEKVLEDLNNKKEPGSHENNVPFNCFSVHTESFSHFHLKMDALEFS